MTKVPTHLFLSYDDVLIRPKLGVVDSRDDIDTSVTLGSANLKIPIISSPMQAVTEREMANAMYRAGGLGVLHRFGDPKWKGWPNVEGPLAVAIGLQDIVSFPLAADLIFLDVAHAHTKKTISFIKQFRQLYPKAFLVAGSVATADAVTDLVDAGADAVRVGIGPGSACSTRVQTGAGVPQLSAIMECSGLGVPVIADGGIRNSGDIVKALAAGADCVMIGRLFAGADEAPMMGEYFGQASEKSAASNGDYIEGVTGWVEDTGPVAGTIAGLMQGVRSGISYAGAHDIKSLHEQAEFVMVTSASVVESYPSIQ